MHLISTFITASWLELEQPVELMKSVFVDAYPTLGGVLHKAY